MVDASAPVRLGLDVAQQRMPWSEVLARVRFAEELGFDGVWGFDHFQPMYGEGPGECFEGMTTLAAWAASTSRIRLGLLVTGMTYRHPSVFAAEAITLDHISAGRLELAYGAAWYAKEHHELGIPFPPTAERIDRFEEAVQVVRGLLTTDGFSFAGRYLTVREATLRPRPVQQPHPPLWIGASGERRMLPIAARHADVWHAFGPPEVLGPKSARLSELAAAAGRDPAAIRRSTSISLEEGVDAACRAVEAWRDAGFTELICGWPSQGRDRVEAFARAVFGS